VYYYFDTCGKNAILEQMCKILNMLERVQVNKEACPSLLIAEFQSVMMSPMMFEERGIDGNKKVNGHKRQVIVDAIGRIWKAQVHATNRHDSPGGLSLLDKITDNLPRLEKVMVDKPYKGTFTLEVKRWTVERIFAWLKFFRRIVVVYEHTTRNSDSFLLLANGSMVFPKINWNEL
jgi:transposase